MESYGVQPTLLLSRQNSAGAARRRQHEARGDVDYNPQLLVVRGISGTLCEPMSGRALSTKPSATLGGRMRRGRLSCLRGASLAAYSCKSRLNRPGFHRDSRLLGSGQQRWR